MSQNQCLGVELQGPLQYFTRVNVGTVDSAFKAAFGFNNAVLVVEVDAIEHFMLQQRQFHHQVIPSCLGSSKGLPSNESALD